MYQTFPIEKEFREVLKWVKRAVSTDDALTALQAILVQGNTLTATDGWRIHRAVIAGANPIPEGLWKIRYIANDLVLAEGIDGKFPDADALIAAAEKAALKPEGQAAGYSVQLALSPYLLAYSMAIGKLAQLVEVTINGGPVIFKAHTDAGHKLTVLLMVMHNGNAPSGTAPVRLAVKAGAQ